MQYILTNKEWLFSGVIPALIFFIAGVILYRIRTKRKKNSEENKPETEKTDNSTNTINQYGEKSVYVKENKGNINIS